MPSQIVPLRTTDTTKSLRVYQAPTHTNAKGSLSVLEGADLPFVVKRIYYIHGVPIGAIRGEHGHRELEQVVFCASGAVEVTICDGLHQEQFTLADPGTLLHIPPGRWRSIKFKEPGTVLCVLASLAFDTSDYIYDYEEFLNWKRSTSNQRDVAATRSK
jgi:uncharacterized RmlC-like cupin family protein